MATNQANIMTSHNLLNYSGMLFNLGNVKTPFSTLIGGKSRTTNSFEFTTSVTYTSGGGTAQPAITETASLTAPTREKVTRSQNTNYAQIFQRALQISYAKQSSMGQLSGLNVAGQSANPASELDFQVARCMEAIANDIEYTFINGQKQNGTHDDVAYKTDGILHAITTNTKAAAGAGLGYWMIAELMQAMSTNNPNADLTGLVLMCPSINIMQLNADATTNGLTVIPAAREINGIKLTNILTPLGEISLLANDRVASGNAVLFNPSYCAPVEMPVPGKGNFFLESLSKTGASDDYQIYGQCGFDFGHETLHGKITGLATTFTAPTYSKKVFVAGGSLTTT